MRFQGDTFAVSTWEADLGGNKIPGTEEQIELGNIGGDFYTLDSQYLLNAVKDAMKERAKHTAGNRYVIGEIWSVDSERPATRLMNRWELRGFQPVPDGDDRLAV